MSERERLVILVAFFEETLQSNNRSSDARFASFTVGSIVGMFQAGSSVKLQPNSVGRITLASVCCGDCSI